MYDHGIRTRAELLAAGIRPGTISRKYHRILPRIYAVTAPTPLARCFAVTVWQPRAVLSHRTAAWLYGWLPIPEVIEATVPPEVRVRVPDWLRLHRRRIDPLHLATGATMPMVTREQALFDCMSVLDGDERDRLVDRCVGGDVDGAAMRLTCAKNFHRRGAPALRQQLRERAVGVASEPERLLARALNERNFALESNIRTDGYTVDFLDERARLVVEVDGREFHSEPGTFRSDRRRQNHLQLRGWLVLRYAAADVLQDPARVAEQIIAVARRRRAARR
ncbi:DUF559 domain-containing protein [Aldersonia sp. NBC_00410]|uniref:DUF559 domain-containing protein n=1 Tax=Aldersonia sp. NBC_00410 TaxID=2975954 RepID=UPI00225A3D7A|nr:DUF559 domain-containing protein [Aldersonia sp. NBC_00410]MCX5044523.1 DUF559 domain-containing protein [Aldersonia sp. NBC_00410]